MLTAEQTAYSIQSSKIDESSGLACSTHNKNVLWTHNDSGHSATIYALSIEGHKFGRFYIEDVKANDWEDMDAFKYNGDSYILIADTGDNFKFRWDYQIIIIKEPLMIVPKKKKVRIKPAWSYVFKYADNSSYDVEAVAVDILQKKVLLLTKRTTHTYLFELPLIPKNNGQMPVAVRVAEFNDIINPTALDISDNGLLMSINTYARIHRFYRKEAHDKWHYDYSLKYKEMYQPEAMCLRESDHKTEQDVYYISSEKIAKLIKVEIAQPQKKKIPLNQSPLKEALLKGKP